MRITLKLRLKLLVAGALVSLAASTSPAQQRVTIAYSAVSPIMAGVWMAKETGAFERHGLKADLVYIASGGITVQAMIGGDLDLSVAASNAVVSAILRGAPLVAVGSLTNRPAMSFWVQPDIAKAEQLRGKIVGITRHGSTTHFLTVAMLERLGLQDKVKLQPFGGTVEADIAFRAGLIAGRISSTKPDPRSHSLVDLSQLGIPFSMDLMAVKRDFNKASPKLVEGMLRAYVEGVAALRKKEEALKVLAKYLRARAGTLDEPYEYAVKYLERDPKVEPAVIQTVLDWEGKAGEPASRFFDNGAVERIAKEGFIDNLYKAVR
jgi:ABC-type nitrate/sulfonate/bicarbonate transport system substrate-binding protein